MKYLLKTTTGKGQISLLLNQSSKEQNFYVKKI